MLLVEWLLPVIDLELVPGVEFTFKTQAYPGWDGTVSCRFVEIETHRKLTYTWTVPFFEAEQGRELGGARHGWKMIGGKLFDLLERT